MIIYKTTNLVNGKIYVGQDSKNDHTYLGSGTRFEKAVKKYGRKNFKKEIIEHCMWWELNDREIYWIAELQATDRDIGYNVGAGGEGFELCNNVWGKGSKHREESLAKMRARRPTPEQLLRIRAYRHSKETRLKMKGIRRGAEARKNMSDAHKDKPGYWLYRHCTKEHKNNISKGLKAHYEKKRKAQEALVHVL